MSLPTGTFLVPFEAYEKCVKAPPYRQKTRAYDNFTQHTIILRLDVNGRLVGFLCSMLMIYEQLNSFGKREADSVHTISSRTSPAAKGWPSFFFHAEIPPSVIVGDMAGIWNRDTAPRLLEECKPLGLISRLPQLRISQGYLLSPYILLRPILKRRPATSGRQQMPFSRSKSKLTEIKDTKLDDNARTVGRHKRYT